MVVASDFQAVAQLFAERMLNSIVQGIAIALFGWMLLRLLGRQNSSTRFAVWFSALSAVAALPFFANANMTAGNATALTLAPRSALWLPGRWALVMFLLWTVIASAGLVRIGFGFWRLRKLRRTCTAISPLCLHPLLRHSLNEFRSVRRLTICTSKRVRVPTAVGFIKPLIVIPSWALGGLSPDELNAVLLHELAHLRRWDDWTNLVQRILQALLFFHPVVWWIGTGLSLEREMACDDFVVAATSNPRAYAQCLVSVAEKNFLRHSLALAQAVVSKVHETSRRVARILDMTRAGDVNHSGITRVSKPVLGLVAAFSAACLVSLPRTPRLVAFEQAPGVRTTSISKSAAVFATNFETAGPRLVPAKLQSRVPGGGLRKKKPDVPAGAVKPEPGNGAREVASLAPIPGNSALVNLVQPQTDSPVRASAAGSRSEISRPSSVLLVVQTQEVDSSGRIVWNFSLWRLTVFHPAEHQVHEAITAKST